MSLQPRPARSVAVGWLTAGAIVFAIASISVGATLGTTIYRMPVALSFLLAAVHGAAIPLAVIRPAWASAITALSVVALAIAEAGGGANPWPWAVPTLVTHTLVLAILGVRANSRFGIIALVAATAGTLVITIASPHNPEAVSVNVIVASCVSGGVLGLAIVFREWRSIRDQLIREKRVSAEEHERRVLAEEKTRIARELHDIVAHGMSIIGVQASTAVYRHPDVPEPVAREFEEIASAARGSLAELRGLLSVLRDESAPRELAPVPRLSDIPALVQATERSGVDVHLRWEGVRDDTGIGEAAGLAAYRIVQEAMSNAIRHAPGARVVVGCERDDSALRLSIVNSAAPAAAEGSEPGHGLVGMRERAASVGGTVDFGATAEGGFAVHATIPVGRSAA